MTSIRFLHSMLCGPVANLGAYKRDSSVNIGKRFAAEWRRRLPIYVAAVFFLWPAISCLVAVSAALNTPYYSLSAGQAALVALGGMVVMAPDILVAGVIGLAVILTLFSLLASLGLIVRTNYRISLALEPAVIFGSILLGASFYYPSVLSHPIFSFLRVLPVWVLTLLLAFIVVVCSARLASPGRRISVVAIILLFAAIAPLPAICRNQMVPTIPAVPPVVLLGIDSVSQIDDLSHIENWTRNNGGAWYTRAVSPGLLTNPVWSSILFLKPVREHGVFHTFQSYPNPSVGSLVDAAKRQGYYTISAFSDQLTEWPGSDCDFDSDLSGPVGWRQLATNIFENASILLPLIKPILPGSLSHQSLLITLEPTLTA